MTNPKLLNRKIKVNKMTFDGKKEYKGILYVGEQALNDRASHPES